jgi:protein-S-isoprenylcysteine O-methyltransferase Ste14
MNRAGEGSDHMDKGVFASFESFSRTKAYDLIAALPLALWYGRAVFRQWPTIHLRLNEWSDGTIDLLGQLQLAAVVGSVLFSLLIILLLVIRTTPRGKSAGLLPRAAAIAGTFITVGIIYLPAQTLPFAVQALADALLLVGSGVCLFIIAYLGQAFSIMPEARKLVTNGPYAIVRHPLYVAEEIGILGLVLQFEQPWATLLALAGIVLQVVRSEYEERVLLAAYPEYAEYRARTWRFIPFVF